MIGGKATEHVLQILARNFPPSGVCFCLFPFCLPSVYSPFLLLLFLSLPPRFVSQLQQRRVCSAIISSFRRAFLSLVSFSLGYTEFHSQCCVLSLASRMLRVFLRRQMACELWETCEEIGTHLWVKKWCKISYRTFKNKIIFDWSEILRISIITTLRYYYCDFY